MESSNPATSRHARKRRERRRGRLRGRMVRVLPSLFTLGNLLCGFAAIFCASRFPEWENSLVIGASLVLIGMVLDALDGRVARLTGQTSELGEQLDSMADMVTFGVAPAFLTIQLVGIGLPIFGETHARWDVNFDRFVFVVSSVYVACAALRLARFNVELEHPGESDHMSFKGLPSPAAAGTVCSLALLQQWYVGHQPPDAVLSFFRDGARMTAVGMVVVTLLSAVAMVSMVRYPHIANRFLRERAPIQYIGAAIFILIPLITYPQHTLAVAFTGFALWGPIAAWGRRSRGAKGSTGPQSGSGERPAGTPPLRLKQN